MLWLYPLGCLIFVIIFVVGIMVAQQSGEKQGERLLQAIFVSFLFLVFWIGVIVYIDSTITVQEPSLVTSSVMVSPSTGGSIETSTGELIETSAGEPTDVAPDLCSSPGIYVAAILFVLLFGPQLRRMNKVVEEKKEDGGKKQGKEKDEKGKKGKTKKD